MKSNLTFWLVNLIVLVAVVLGRALGIIEDGTVAMAATIVPSSLAATLPFGVQADHVSLTSQRISVSNKSDKKMARDKGGNVIAVAFYNESQDINIEVLGVSDEGIGSVITLTDPPVAMVGAVMVDEVTVDEGNEDFTKSSLRATAFSGIAGA